MKLDDGSWNISKCRRALRPLQSKIISFKDLITKYPSYLNTEIIERNQKFTVRTYKKSKKRYKSRDFDYGYNSDNEITFMSTNDPNISDISPVQSDSQNRFKKLSKSIPQETIPEYKEILQIFKNFIATVYFTKPNKLQQLCSLKLGKCIVVTSKLNNTMFENNHKSQINPITNEPYIDENEWYEFNPGMFQYNRWILLGHGIELINLNIDCLYLIIPTLIHYLVENDCLEIARNMCFNYLRNFPNTHLFWKFYQAGYLKDICDVCGIVFEDLVLESIPNKITTKILMQDEFYVLEEIYKLILTSVSKFRKINLLIILKKFKKICSEIDNLDEILILMVNCIQVWLEVFSFYEFNFNALIFNNLTIIVNSLKDKCDEDFTRLNFENLEQSLFLINAIQNKVPTPSIKAGDLSSIMINLLPSFKKLHTLLKVIVPSYPTLVINCLKLYEEEFENLSDYNDDLSKREFHLLKEGLLKMVNIQSIPINIQPYIESIAESSFVGNSSDEQSYNFINNSIINISDEILNDNTNNTKNMLEELDHSTSMALHSEEDEPTERFSSKLNLIRSIEKTISKNGFSSSPIRLNIKNRRELVIDDDEGDEDYHEHNKENIEAMKLSGSPVNLKRKNNDDFITFRRKFKRNKSRNG